MKLKVNIFNNQKKLKLDCDNRKLIRNACKATLKYEKFSDDASVDVTIVDDEKIKQMNNDYRGIDKSTDVLSFPLGENGVYETDYSTGLKMLGDIVISIDHALYQAELYGHGTEREIAFLCVHSMLHLLGYDHVNNEEEEKDMRHRQTEILESMGLFVK